MNLKDEFCNKFMKNNIFIIFISLLVLFNFATKPAYAASTAIQSFTISAWIKPTSSITSKAIVVKNNEIRLVTDNSGHLICQYYGGSSWQTPVVSSTALTTGSWQHVTCTYTYKDKTLSAFINGIQSGDSQFNQGSSGTTTHWRFGSDESASYADFSGKIDEVRIYNRALSPGEVQALYNWAPGPVGYWKMDENTGTSVSDSSGNNNVGAFSTTGTSWATGKFGSGIKTDGINGYTDIPDNDAFSLITTGQLTVEGWFKMDSFDFPSFTYIFSKRRWGGDMTNYEWDIRVVNTGRVGCYFHNSAAGAYFEIIPSTVYYTTTGQWHHLACTANTSIPSATLYVDGVVAGTSTIISGSLNNGTAPVRIGKDPEGDANGFNGTADDVRIYNYTRGPAQIVEDMNAGHPAPGSPVGSAVGHWNFDEGYSTTAYDISTNSLNLTLSSATWTNIGKFNKAWHGNGSNRLSITDAATGDKLDFTATESAALSTGYKRIRYYER
jgi:Concanavalin A-like lectin/glucanases superfamily